VTAAAVPPEASGHRRIVALGIALLVAFAALIAWSPESLRRLQLAGFDTYQRVKPRTIGSRPITIVEIDDRSLARFGQWPWPRTLLAELVRAIARGDPAAIGLDFLLAEPDRWSPDRSLASVRKDDPVLASRLDALPSNDRVLAQALQSTRVVLAHAGSDDANGAEPLGPPFLVVDRTGRSGDGHAPASALPAFAGATRNLDELDRSASGHGLISAAPGEDVIRRMPVAARVADRLVPSLTTEMLRVALGVPDVRLVARGEFVAGISIGTVAVPTESDGQVRLYYSERDALRYVSAADVLDGTVDPDRLARKLVLVGVTGLGMVDYQATPLGTRMPGSEIHAQLVENLVDQASLHRPDWAPLLEAAIFALLGLGLVWATPRWKPGRAALFAVACVALPVALGATAFASRRLLFDAAIPAAALLLLFTVLLVATLAETARQRRALELAVRRQREEAAYVAGELSAARRIQLGFLPVDGSLSHERRVEVAASMVPAREVGGDLYDYFLVDANRLFFIVGDVAGKGLSASLFMAVSKALVKSVSLRSPGATAGDLLRSANEEIGRDNRESFFVTAFAAILDLATGVLDYANAGQDDPYVLGPDDDVARLTGGAGPPLCAVDGFPYASGVHRLRAGEVVCVVTDGAMDARSTAGERFGNERVRATLAGLASDRTAHGVVEALSAGVAAFSAGAEPADDLTVLAVRWTGPVP
jgi:CHASE2 domain-containing sensor protein/serine phosphatase RsbU (regulator of sigma subunit)